MERIKRKSHEQNKRNQRYFNGYVNIITSPADRERSDGETLNKGSWREKSKGFSCAFI